MSTYYTIMSMIDGFKSFINLAVMVLTIVASWIMYAKAGEHGWAETARPAAAATEAHTRPNDR